MFRTIYGDEPTELTLTAKASEAYDNSDVTIVEYTSEDDGSVICYDLYNGRYLSSRHLISEDLTADEVNEYFEDLHDEIMGNKKMETYSITLDDWRRSGAADWDYFKRYLGNVVANMRGDTYELALNGDDVNAWMESEIDDLVIDGKVTGDSTDEELNRVADDICVEYINSEIGDVYGYAVHPEFRKLSPEAIVDLYRRGVGLDTLVQSWLYTERDNMREVK